MVTVESFVVVEIDVEELDLITFVGTDMVAVGPGL